MEEKVEERWKKGGREVEKKVEETKVHIIEIITIHENWKRQQVRVPRE